MRTTIEIEISDVDRPITREEVVAAAARSLVAAATASSERLPSDIDASDEGERSDASRASARWLRDAVEDMFSAQLREAVRRLTGDELSAQIKARVVAAVEQVLIDGWTPTDQWGNQRGLAQSLKARIHALAFEDRYDKPALVTETTRKVVAEFFTKEFKAEIEEARLKLRTQLGTLVAKTFADTVAAALTGRS